MCHSLCVIVPLLPRQDMSVKTSNLLLQNFYKKRTITSIEPSKVCFYREDICFIFWEVSIYPGLSRRSVEPYLHCFFFQGFDSSQDLFMITGLPHVWYFLYYGKNRKLSCIFQYFVDLSCIVLFFRYISYQNESCLFYSLKIVLLIEKTSSFLDFT